MTRILVIEDDTDLRRNLVDLLELEDYEVYSGADGEEGLACAREHHPDLIVCDIMMPKLDGYGVLKALRISPDSLMIPVIFLTAKTDRQSVRMGMELGADDYLTKPFTQQELLQSIQTQLNKRTAIREALRRSTQPSDDHEAKTGDH